MFEAVSTATIGVLVVTFLATLIVRSPSLALTLLAVNIVFLRELETLPPITAAGVTVGLPDATTLACLLAALITVSRRQKGPAGGRIIPAITVPLVLVILMVSISLARGLTENDFGTSFNEARYWVYMAALFAWVASVRATPDLNRAMVRFSIGLIVGLALIATYHIAIYGFGSVAYAGIGADGEALTGRPLNAGQSLAITLAGLLLLHAWLRVRGRLYLALALVAFVFCIIAQNRSAWLALIAGVAVLLLLASGAGKARLTTIGAVGGLGLAILVVSGWLDTVLARLTESAENSGTYEARVEGWLALLSQAFSSGPLDVLIGFPFGTGWGRVQSGQYVEYSPHNWYVTVFLRLGAIGLVLLVVALVAALLRGVARRATTPAAALVAASVVYSWTYTLDWFVAPLLAWSLLEATNPAHRTPLPTGLEGLRVPDGPASRSPRRRGTSNSVSRAG